MPLWIEAFLWGGLAGGALLIGAVIGYFSSLKQRTIAGIMAFGSGVLISALSFELMEEAYEKGGFLSTAVGFIIGASVYTFANRILAMLGAKHRKRSGKHQQEEGGNGAAIAVGATIDGIPESLIIGLSMLEGGVISIVTVAAIFISNIPEGLSSSAGMKKAGKSAWYVFFIWGMITILSALASLAGFSLFEGASLAVVALVMAIAAGAILAMIVDTMIPEAFAETHDYAGLITVIGFLLAFALEKMM